MKFRTSTDKTNYFITKARRFGAKATLMDEQSGLWLLEKNNRSFMVKNHVIDLDHFLASRVTSNKTVVKRVLDKYRIPVPWGIEESSMRRSFEMLHQGIIGFPLVVKPVDGSQGFAVMADIRSEHWFGRAMQEVVKYNRRTKGKPGKFLLEEYVRGDDYRFLVLDGKVLTVLRREPAYVIGDGKYTIDELIKAYNVQPDVGPLESLCPIVCDYELERVLTGKNMRVSDVPEKHKKVYLRKNANVHTGGRSFECADYAHPAYKKMAARVAKIFQMRFCAVDLISPNISKFTKFAVIEVNSTPGYDIHEEPYRGKPCPVSDYLLEAAFGK